MSALPLVIVNGLGTPLATAEMYGLVFRARGFAVHIAPQRFLGFGDVRVSARLLGEEIDRVRSRTGADRVRVVGMSLGGLIGLYYLKCLGGAATVERFIAVASPLNGTGSTNLLAKDAAHALAQAQPKSDLIRELASAPSPANVRMYSVGALADPIIPRAAWDAPGLEPVIAPVAGFPFGHWALFMHPANHRVVLDVLGDP